MEWELGICCAEARHEVVFKSLYGAFGGIPAMDVGRNELIGDAFAFDVALECLQCLVVEFLKDGLEAAVDQILVQFVVGANVLGVRAAAKGLARIELES